MSLDSPPDTTHQLPLSVGLLSRRSLIGGTVVLVVALFYMLGVPALNQAVRGENDFIPGEPYVVAGSVQITPADGWQLDPSSNDLFSTFTKAGAALVITPAVDATQTAEEIAEVARLGLENDETTTWVIGDPQTFVTNVGDHGVSLTAHSTNNAQETFAIVTDTKSVTIIGTSPDSVWSTVSGDMDLMVRSVVILEGGDA